MVIENVFPMHTGYKPICTLDCIRKQAISLFDVCLTPFGPRTKILSKDFGSICKLLYWPSIVLLLLLRWLIGFHMLSYIWPNEILSVALTLVEQQLSWCKSRFCFGCWSIGQQQSAELSIHCTFQFFQLVHSVSEGVNWSQYMAIRRRVSSFPVSTCKIPFKIGQIFH